MYCGSVMSRRLLLPGLLLLLACSYAQAGRLTVRVEHRWNGKPLVLADPSLRNAADNQLSVTRLAYLLSRAQLRTADGRWIGANDWFAFLDVEKQRTQFTLGNVPPDTYTALRFELGLDESTDRGDPALGPVGHPLHPDLNGLHWSWRSGYVFLAVEGRHLGRDGESGGFSYHLAGQPCRGTVEVPAELDLRSDLVLTLAFDADQLFSGVHRIDIHDAASTHSQNDGGLAERMADNALRGFALLRLEPDLGAAREAAAGPTAANVPALLASRIPAHFPQAVWPADNPLTKDGVALGRQLFHEPRLSINNTQSCASCHPADGAFADSRRTSPGAEAQPGRRNAMPLFNLAWKPAYFWDGRSPSLRDQVLRPIQDPTEMHETLAGVEKKLAADSAYPAALERAFGSPAITSNAIARALEQFLLTLVSSGSKLDLTLSGKATLTEQEQLGFKLFFTESDPARGIRGADCFHCHGGAHFTNNQFLNNGLDPDEARQDEGRFEITRSPADRGKFIVPSLRNIARTAPYMHDGRFATLEQVVAHYDHGLRRSPTLDPNLAKHLAWNGLGLTQDEKAALVAFLKTLTDEEFGKAARD